MYAQIALPIPGEGAFDYLVPSHLENLLQIGMRVRVPLARRIVTGFCVGLSDQTRIAIEKLREIDSILDLEPVVETPMLQFAEWWAGYYHCSIGEALAATVPAEVGVRAPVRNSLVCLRNVEGLEEWIEVLGKKYPAQSKVLVFLQECRSAVSKEEVCRKLQISQSPLLSLHKRGLIEFVADARREDPTASLPPDVAQLPVLNPEQELIVTELKKIVDAHKFHVALLFGVTGSGKTEVYLRILELVVAKGRQGIVLVPEIALTPQTVIRFKQRFPKVAVLHSGLTTAQRAHAWEQIHAGEIDVVIGARSAIFAPTRNLGLIVVDEEHEPSFKQESTPRYHARDLAVKRAQLQKAMVILGSATPSLESYHNASVNKYQLYNLPHRIGNAKLPKFLLVDMKDECRIQKQFVYFSRTLLQELERCLKAGEQAILFLNRRGFATTILCPACGFHMRCPHCDVSLTYHKKGRQVLCHYCGYETTAPTRCPTCQFEGIRFLGAGTERIDTILDKMFPKARIMRMDSDSMTTRRRYEEAFLAFSRGEIDILLGTQMIAKGLDFPRVTLVGIVTADTSLQLPDFRSAERTFQLLVQVAGRAGRGERPGTVILQTFTPQHYAITSALSQNYEKFVAYELKMRQDLGYPPFGKLLRVMVEAGDEKAVRKRAEELAEVIRNNFQARQLEMLGPTPAPILKINDRYRWHIIVKSSHLAAISQCARLLEPWVTGSASVRVQLDKDPIALI